MKATLPIIKKLDFPESQYIKQAQKKNKIVLHHTGSGRGATGDYKYWLNDPKRIATCVIIDADGVCNQLYSSEFWGFHIGRGIESLERESIGIEIDSWGGLTFDEKNKKFISYTNTPVPKENVIEYEKSFRGYRFFERYTDDQLEATRKLLIYWNEKYGIPITYREDMWDVSLAALNGEPGVFSHCSYRKDKSDVHPQPELIQMLKSL
jgi:N-acetyl-anhydromuramyl-L-alanine amidase AmpD